VIRLANFGEVTSTKFHRDPFSSLGDETRDRPGKSSAQWVHVQFVRTRHNVQTLVTRNVTFPVTFVFLFHIIS
jgi:hypothetical protein